VALVGQLGQQHRRRRARHPSSTPLLLARQRGFARLKVLLVVLGLQEQEEGEAALRLVLVAAAVAERPPLAEEAVEAPASDNTRVSERKRTRTPGSYGPDARLETRWRSVPRSGQQQQENKHRPGLPEEEEGAGLPPSEQQLRAVAVAVALMH
jgi:hypothetical protein